MQKPRSTPRFLSWIEKIPVKAGKIYLNVLHVKWTENSQTKYHKKSSSGVSARPVGVVPKNLLYALEKEE